MRQRVTVRAALCLAGLLAFRLWVVEPVTVSSGSMEPTVAAGSLVWLDKATPRLCAVRTGDLVVFRTPEAGEHRDGGTMLKRVVAQGGQTVSILDGLLHVDGRPAAEPYVDQRSIDGVYFGTVTVPAGKLFVLGDNRETSIDSRDFGPIPVSEVLGVVLGHG